MEAIQSNSVNINLWRVSLKGVLTIPPSSKGIVIFSHGSGSSHLSPRNEYIAGKLNSRKFGTLLFDLLTEEEDININNRFDIELLTNRLIQTSQWLREQSASANLSLAFFGASTGAASALRTAALLGKEVKAVVSRGGRPDLAGDSYLEKVTSPTLLLVGGNDKLVLNLNENALQKMNCTRELKINPEADHLFSEPGKLEQVALLSNQWFDNFLN
jgi:dienelactone hydrolase